MTTIAKAAVLALGLSCAVSALAQDGAAPKPASPKPVAHVTPVAAAPKEAAPAHPESTWAVERAREARRQAACLQRRANAVDKAASKLDAAAPESEEMEAALAGVGSAVTALDACGSLGEPEVSFSGVEVLDDPCSGDPLCSDDVSLVEGLEDSLRKANTELHACYQLALARDPDRRGELTYEGELAEVESAQIVKLTATEDTLGDKRARACVDKQLKALRFGVRQRTKRVRFGLSFSPG
jgi:hypothetical protein